MEEKQLKGASFGVFLLFLGTIFFLINIGIISLDAVISFFLTFWPLLIVVAGIKIVIRAFPHGRLLSFIFSIVFDILMIVGFIYWRNANLVIINTSMNDTRTAVQQSEYPNVTEKAYSFRFGATKYTISDTDSSSFVSYDGPSESDGIQTVITPTLNNSTLSIDFHNEFKRIFWFGLGYTNLKPYTVTLGVPTVPTNLTVDTGASQGDITMTKTPVKNVSMQLGAGQINATFTGNSVPDAITLKAGAGQMHLVLPKDTNITVTYSAGAGNVHVIDPNSSTDRNFGGLGAHGMYKSTNASTTAKNVTINASVGAGELVIELL